VDQAFNVHRKVASVYSFSSISRVEYFRKALEYDPVESELLPPEEAVIDMTYFREACFQGKQGPTCS
jgi:hypothetical protein